MIKKYSKFLGVLLTLALLLAVLPAGSVLADDPHIITVTNISGLQNALDHNANNYPNGSIVQVSNGGTWEGNLKINQPIIFRTTSGQPPFTIKGQLEINYEGDDALLIQNIIFEADPEFEHDNVVISKGKNITIEDCVFDGKDPDFHPSISTHRAVQMSKNAENILIDNCKFKDGYYVTIQGYAKGLTVKGSTINNVKSGINHQGGGDLTVEDCEITNKPVDSGNSYGLRYTAEKNEDTKLTITESIFNIELSDLPIAPGPDKIHASIITRGDGADKLKAYENQIYGKVVNSTPTTFQAINNYWGSPCGPDPDKIEGPVVYSPWYIDEEMTTLSDVGPVSSTFTFPVEMETTEKNAIIACAAPGTTFTFAEGTHAGGIEVLRNDVTFNLNGATIEVGSPAFTLDGDTITINGPGLLDGNGTDHAILVKDGSANITINLLEIKNWADGVHYAGDITNTQVVDSYFHELSGNGVHFTNAPTIQTDLSFYIQGNMFLMESIGGYGVNAPDALDVTYNSWGKYVGPETSDLPSIFTAAHHTPYTHVDLYLEPVDHPLATNSGYGDWPWQVFVGESIKYEVKANLVNAIGLDYTFTYDATRLTNPVIANVNTDFAPLIDNVLVDTTILGEISFKGITTDFKPLTEEDIVLFEVTFTASETHGQADLEFDNTTDVFSMFPSTGPSHNIYAYKLVDRELKVITRPTLDLNGLDPDLIAGISREIVADICNDTTGGIWEYDWSSTPGVTAAIAWIRITDVKLEDIDSLEFWYYDDQWHDFDLMGGTPVRQDGEDLLIRFGNHDHGFNILQHGCDHDPFRITFKKPGTHEISVEVYDLLGEQNGAEPERIPDYYLLTSFGPKEFTVKGDFGVTGTVSMQGRTVRAGVPFTLTDTRTPPLYVPNSVVSTAPLAYNVKFAGVNGGFFQITTNQPRYLNIIESLNKTIHVNDDFMLEPLELKGGDVVQDEKIDVGDASLIGTDYGTSGDPQTLAADTNFDGKVNIQDLALVGGNYGLTPALAYADWQPPVFNGLVSGIITESGGQISGYLTGDFNITITGQFTVSNNGIYSFTGTATGDISGTFNGKLNRESIDVLYGTVEDTGAVEPVRIIGHFLPYGEDGVFVGRIITGDEREGVSDLQITGPTTVKVGESIQLGASGTNLTDQELLWFVHYDNDDMATITKDGLLTGLVAGSGKVYVHVLDDKNISFTHTVITVTEQ